LGTAALRRCRCGLLCRKYARPQPRYLLPVQQPGEQQLLRAQQLLLFWTVFCRFFAGIAIAL